MAWSRLQAAFSVELSYAFRSVLRSLTCRAWLRLAPLALLPGCLVSFNDYPLGAGPTPTSGASSGGSAGAMPSGGAQASSGSASGGRSGSGGSAVGDAGANEPNAGAPSSNGPATLIDDFEDNDAAILAVDGRSGSWYVINDGQGMQTPGNGMLVVPSDLMPLRGGSEQGLHTSGGPFAQWGALVGTSLASSSEVGVPYDLSAYAGIRFWVRTGSQFAVKQVRVNLPTPGTNSGGPCSVCNDHWGAVVPLTSQWTQVQVRFADLDQAGFGVPQLQSPELTHVTAIQFIFAQGVSFDLWLDDIEFF